LKLGFVPKTRKNGVIYSLIFFAIFVREGVGLPASIILFLEAVSVQENYCFNNSCSTVQPQTHVP
jgi:hypothetical protein